MNEFSSYSFLLQFVVNGYFQQEQQHMYSFNVLHTHIPSWYLKIKIDDHILLIDIVCHQLNIMLRWMTF